MGVNTQRYNATLVLRLIDPSIIPEATEGEAMKEERASLVYGTSTTYIHTYIHIASKITVTEVLIIAS